MRFNTDDGVVQAVDGVSFDVRRGEVVRHRRRVGLGQVGHGDERSSACCRRRRPRSSAARSCGRARTCSTARPSGMRAGPRRRDRDDLPGPADRAEPGPHGRRPDRRDGPRSTDDVAQEQARDAGHRDARPGRHPAARAPGRPVPARVLRRHAPAGHDRHGDRLRPRRCSSPTSRPPPSTSPCRRRCSRCCWAIQDAIDSAIMLITHDLGVVAGVADRVMVMYAGRQVEIGHRRRDLLRAAHPYTLGLLASLPRLDGAGDEPLIPIGGQPPSLIDLPPGCAFHPARADYAVLAGARASDEVPALRTVDGPTASRRLPLRRGRHQAAGDLRCAATATDALTAGRDVVRRRPAPTAAEPILDGPRPGQGVPGARRRRSRGAVGHGARGAPACASTWPGRDPRPGGRVGLRQVDHRPAAAAAHRRHVGRGALRGPATIAELDAADDARRLRSACRSCSRTPTPRSTRA